MLRDYQQRAIDQLYDWFEGGNEGNPCLVLPTGSGKSHIIAELCKDALQKWPETSVLMLTHVKELIEQNAEKVLEHWPNAPLGIYSASIGMKQLGRQITFAGIQSIRDKANEVGYVDLVIIDECHLVNHREAGGYRTFLSGLKVFNPNLRVIGLTATPYRLKHGMITDKPALFDAIIEPVGIEELIYKNYLAILRSKATTTTLDTSKVKKRGGEFIESELQAAVNTSGNNGNAVREIISLAGDRKAWLLFCTGVKHAQNIAELLNQADIKTACIIGTTPKPERERILEDFKAGTIRAITNANVLTTGFNYPDIDLIAMLRPTMSPGLYVQMAGRGMRVKSHTDHCLVLDFAGVVATHGPITAIEIPKNGGNGKGAAPVKTCPICYEICPISVQVCPACGTPFPASAPKKLKLRHDDIMGLSGKALNVTRWNWRRHMSQSSGKLMLSCTYYGALSDRPITEYFPVTHGGYAGTKAIKSLSDIAKSSHADFNFPQETDVTESIDKFAVLMNKAKSPMIINYSTDGKFHRVISRTWVSDLRLKMEA